VSGPRVVVVVKRTPYSRYVEEEKDPEVRRLIRRGDPTVARWLPAHQEHVQTFEEVQRVLQKIGARVWVVHGPRVQFDASDAALVVTVGGDGTLLAASHHVENTPILGINSSPFSSVGFFCVGHRLVVERMLPRALEGKLDALQLSRMQVCVNGRVVSRRVLNEVLFCHETPAAASRYILEDGKRSEPQVSSGFWVGTAAGSTGALRSAGGVVQPLSARTLQLVVREPITSARRKYKMTRVIVPEGKQITAISKMHDARIFLDGPYKMAPVRLADNVSFSLSEEPVKVLGLSERKGRGRAK
jgi:NAD+ kinase